MNKRELIKHIEDLPYKEGLIVDKIDISRKGLLELVKQLDEPGKVTIPQFVANWIEYCKFTHVDLQHALIVGDVYFYNYANQKDFSKLKEFLETENNQELFARAWLDGYEVEKEKQYKVVMPNISSTGGVLTRIKHDDSWIWIDTLGTIVEGRTHTHKELEDADFGWVFDCPGIKIEELEE
ncbi:TPA: DUF1642 domain-containing protein [Enterococcus faecium]|nr:DUF1642 domain-containing protein [Enterococcus faecium]